MIRRKVKKISFPFLRFSHSRSKDPSRIINTASELNTPLSIEEDMEGERMKEREIKSNSFSFHFPSSSSSPSSSTPSSSSLASPLSSSTTPSSRPSILRLNSLNKRKERKGFRARLVELQRKIGLRYSFISSIFFLFAAFLYKNDHQFFYFKSFFVYFIFRFLRPLL